MIRISRASVIVCALMLQTTVLLAQQRPAAPRAGRGDAQLLPVQQRGMEMLDQMAALKAELKLSDEQQAKFDTVIQKTRQNLLTLRPTLMPYDPPIRRQLVQAQIIRLSEEIKLILSDQQLEVLRPRVAEILRSMPTPAAPATQPGTTPPVPMDARGPRGARGAPGAQPPRLGVLMERLGEYVRQIDLSDEQKTQVNKLFDDTRRKMQQFRQQTDGPPAAMNEKAQGLVDEMRVQLGAILTTKQQEHLRDLIAQGGPAVGAAPMNDGAMIGGMAAGAPPAADANAAPAVPEIPLIDIGKTAPDFTLRKLDSTQTVQLSSLKGKYVLLVFGSYSSPSFRQRAAAIELLRQNYATKITTIVIYTRENYPTGQWNVERNKEDGVVVEQPADMNGRTALAKQARTTLKLSNSTILMDDMEDSVAKAYGGATNAAVLIGRDGVVVAHQKWFEPYAMRRMIDAALSPVGTPTAVE